MRGIDADTGKAIDGVAHLRQSVRDIITTPLGSRVCRRDYGSLVPELVDQPAHPAGRLRLFAATAVALLAWEPRLRASRITLVPTDQPGIHELRIEGRRTDAPIATGRTLLTVPLRANRVLSA